MTLIKFQNKDSNQIEINIENYIIKNIESNFYGSILFDFEVPNGNFSLKNGFFSNNFAGYLINIRKKVDKVMINNISFFRNRINFQNLYLEEVNLILINSLTCLENNNEVKLAGGCICIKNSVYRTLSNITIKKCFTNLTAAGLIIIDDIDIKADYYVLFSNL